MRKSDLNLFTPNSESVCRIMDGSTNAYLREARIIEEFLKSIEPNYNAALAKVIEGKIDRESIYVIAGFAAYVITCSPTGMRLNVQPLEALVEELAIGADERGLIPLPPQELGGRHLAELLQAGDIEINVDPKYPQALGISQIFGLVAAFGNFEWDVLLNRFEDSPFFTSDYPIAIEQGDDPRLVNRIVPLAPNLAVRIKPNFKVDRRRADFSCKHFRCRMRTASRKEVAAINRAIVQCAEDAIFYRDNLLWCRSLLRGTVTIELSRSLTGCQPRMDRCSLQRTRS